MSRVRVTLAALACLAALCRVFVYAQEGALRADRAAGRRTPELKLSPRSLAMLEAEQAEGAVQIEAGEIPRAALQAELQRGIGAFLQQVRAKPALKHGRFTGWRVIELFKRRPEVHVLALRPGDTVLRVNGRSLERPEQFKLVWDSLADAPELVLEIKRGARRCRLRYAIVD